MVKYEQIETRQLVQSHLSHIRNISEVDTNIDVFFNIQPFVQMKLSWASTSMTPSLTRYRNANIMLSQTVSISTGSCRSAAEEFWNQITQLSEIKSCITSYRDETDKLFYTSSAFQQNRMAMFEIENEIEKILSDPSSYWIEDKSDVSDLELVILQASKRELFDITDKLWSLLRSYSVY